MTKGGLSKTVAFGIIAMQAIVEIARADDGSSNRKLNYCILLAVLIVGYWIKQTFLEYMGEIRNKKGELQ